MKICALVVLVNCVFFPACSVQEDASQSELSVPSYLTDYSDLYAEDPRTANLQWFEDADWGLFLHYGLYALMEQGEWVQLRHDPPVPVAEYSKLVDQFTAENFDAEFMVDFVKQVGMDYITITSKHHDGFALFDTAQNDFDAPSSAAQRDLIGELYEACEKGGVGLFLYYSIGADWKHPYFYPREAGWENARPAYAEPQPEYLFESDEDFAKYHAFADAQVKELLIQYPNIAGIWFDPIMGYYARPDLFDLDNTYGMIRELSPHALISFKQGATGEEDFVAPERHVHGMVDRVRQRMGDEAAAVTAAAWEKNESKPREICDTMQPVLPGIRGGSTWGYNKAIDGKHLTLEQVLERYDHAQEIGANLLLNIGPKPDGSFPAHDVETLIAAGKTIRQRGQ